MWYSDPFLILPAVMAGVSLFSFVIMVILGWHGHALTARIFAAIFAAFASASAFGFTFGYYIRHTEEMNKWIGTILQ